MSQGTRGYAVIDAGLVGAPAGFGFAGKIGGNDSSGTFVNEDTANQIGTDAAGNIYVAGVLAPSDFSVDLDAGIGTYFTGADSLRQTAYLAKYTPAGALIWARNIYTTNSAPTGASNAVRGLAVSPSGVVTVAGWVNPGLTYDFGTTFDGKPNTLAYFTYNHGFVSQFDADGRVLWTRHINGTGNNAIIDLAQAGDGSIYITGSFFSTATFNSPGVGLLRGAFPGSDLFVAKYDASGNFQWVQTIGSPTGSEDGRTLAIAPNGDVIVGGAYNIISSPTRAQSFLGRWTATGTPLWQRTWGSATGFDQVNDVALSPDGAAIYLTGRFSGGATFTPAAGTIQLTATGPQDAYLAMADSAGTFQWAHRFGGNDVSEGQAVSALPSGEILFGGYISGNNSVDFDPGAGSTLLSPNGYYEGFVGQYTPAGALTMAFPVGGPQPFRRDRVNAIHATADGGYIIGGSFAADVGNTVRFHAAGTTAITSAAANIDSFFAKTYPATLPPAPLATVRQQFLAKGGGAIYGKKFHDLDGDNSFGGLDVGVEGWTIYLDINHDGVADRTTLTDRNGDYSFTDLTINSLPYTVWEGNNPAWTPTDLFGTIVSVAVDQVNPVRTVDFANQRRVRILASDELFAPLLGPVAEGASIFLQAELDPALTNVSYLWSIDPQLTVENNIPVNSPSGFARLLDEGTYRVTLFVSSSQGLFTDTFDLFAFNVPPQVALLQPSLSVVEGSILDTSTVFAATDDSLDQTYYDWDFNGDGLYDLTTTEITTFFNWGQLRTAGVVDGPGIFPLQVRAYDEDILALGPAAVASLVPVIVPLNVLNAPPIADAGGAYRVDEGLGAQLSAAASYDPAGPSDTLSYAWDLDNDGQYDDASGVTVNFSSAQLNALGLNDSGQVLTVFLRVTDKDGGQGFASATVELDNVAPRVDALGDALTVEEGTTVAFDGAFTDPGASDDWSFNWTVVHNGATIATGTAQAFSFVPPDQGSYLVSYTVTDDELGINFSQLTVTAVNRVPIGIVVATASAPEGPLTFNMANLQDGPADLAAGLRYSYDFTNDGTFEIVDSLTPAATFSPPDQGDYTIRVRITDKDNATRIVTTNYNVTNAPPTAVLGLNLGGVISEGAAGLQLRFTGASDPSSADTAAGFRYSYDLDGNGTFDPGLIDLAGVSAQPLGVPQEGQFLARARITDKDGGFRDYSLNYIVANAPPAGVTASGATTVSEGQTWILTGGFIDPGADQWLATAQVTKTGVPGDPGYTVPVVVNQVAKTYRLEHVFATDVAAGYDVRVTVSDGVASGQSQLFHVNVTNILPVIDAQAATIINRSVPFARTIGFADPGADAWRYSVNYDYLNNPTAFSAWTSTDDPADPADSPKTFDLGHLYAAPGEYRVRVRVTDQAGVNPATFVAAEFIVTVTANDPPTVAAPILDLALQQGSTPTYANYAYLRQVFADIDDLGEDLVFTVQANTNPSLVSVSIDPLDDSLDLSFLAGQNGTATITVRAANPHTPGNFVTDTFVVTISSMSGTPVPASGLSATPTAANKIQLTWSDNAANETGYRVERSTAGPGGPFTTIATLPANTTSFTNSQLQSYINYTYRVVATGGSDSSPSNTAAASTTLELIIGANAADTYRVRRVGSLLEVYENTLPGPGIAPDYSAELAAMNTGLLTFNTLGGGDQLFIDSNGAANFGALRFVFNAGSGANTLQITAGTARVDSTAIGGTLDTTIQANATLLTAGLRQRHLTLTGSNATARILPNGAAAGLVVLTGNLNIANDAVLDLNDNDLVLFYDPLLPSPIDVITGYVDNYYSFGSVPGGGVPVIGSTEVDNASGSRLIIPVDNINSQFGDINNPFYDLVLGDSNLGTGFNQVIVRFTYPGDYNLDGQVDGSDYTVVDSFLGTPTPGLSAGWTLGDGDFDGVVTPADYLPIDSNFGSGVGNPLAVLELQPLGQLFAEELFAQEQDWQAENRETMVEMLAGAVWQAANTQDKSISNRRWGHKTIADMRD
ncbi:MAG: fibronectin type III domain-containing protein [Pirellulales bacterium]|nr:fibronectin type III domain-containing protein [Pirellulales bacterium]